MKKVLLKIKNSFAIVVILGAFIASAVAIGSNRVAEAPPGTITIRIGHWQLEPGFREAMENAAKDYQELHPNVRVILDSIPETTYGQWVTTQLMGETAPDLMEIGNGLPQPIWVSYYNRYFIPVSPIVGRPNPYNKGTELEDVPLKNTYKDGMRSAYIEELQEYMNFPIAQHSVRLFYNKDLLKKLTGLDTAPTEYRAFLEVCAKIAEHKNSQGKPYIPIAGSTYNFTMWEGKQFDPLTYTAVWKADFGQDGKISNDEMFTAFRLKLLSFDFEPYRRKFEMVREVNKFFPSGYTGMLRDDAVFSFAQQRAVFISTGTWDAGGLIEQAKGRFELGISVFPTPSPDDPVYGKFILGPIYEVTSSSCLFAVNRTSKNPEVAQDFMLFLTSQKVNEKFNGTTHWIPCIIGTKLDPILARYGFEPILEGIFPAFPPFLGGRTQVRWTQSYSNYQIGRTDYDGFRKDYEEFYMTEGLKDFQELQRDQRRAQLRTEQILVTMRGRALAKADPVPDNTWLKYRSVTRSRQLMIETANARKIALANGKLDVPAPYDYTPEAEERIRKSLSTSPESSSNSSASPSTSPAPVQPAPPQP